MAQITNTHKTMENANDKEALANDLCKLIDETQPEEDVFDLADFFKVFADSSRLKVLWALRHGELCVTHLAAQLHISAPAVSHQLKILRQRKLVNTRRVGKKVYCFLADDHVYSILKLGMEHMLE